MVYLRNFCLYFLLWLTALHASSEDLSRLDAAKVFHQEHVYKIVGEGHTSYLYGGVDIRPEPFALPKTIQQIIPVIDCLVTEVDFAHDQHLISFRQEVHSFLLANYDESIFKTSRPFFAYLEEHNDPKRDIPFIPFFMPWLFISTNGKVAFTDKMLYQACEGKKVAGLEDFRELKTLMISEQDPSKFATGLLGRLYEYEGNPFWQSLIEQNMDFFYFDRVHKAKIDWNSVYQSMFTFERNKARLPKMVDYMKKSRTLFSVASSCLPTRKGLLYLLLDEGYQVYRLTPNGKEVAVTKQNYNDPFCN